MTTNWQGDIVNILNMPNISPVHSVYKLFTLFCSTTHLTQGQSDEVSSVQDWD